MLSTTKHLREIFDKTKTIANLISQNVKLLNNLSTKATEIEEKQVDVDGVIINYAKTGKGEHPVLLLPGSMGTIWTDFKPQIENLKKENLTIIAWDPPGYGKSRPPDRTFPENFYKRDAIWAYNFMKTLGFDKFSLMGWSDGGITSLILAAMYPENIQKMITIAAHSYITPGQMEQYEKIRNIDTWSERVRTPLLAIYDKKYFQDTWSQGLDRYKYILENNNGDLIRGELSKIKCPTLIVHGRKDRMSFVQHADYLQVNVKDSKVKIFEDGAHNLHLTHADEFNTLAYKFLVDQENIEL